MGEGPIFVVGVGRSGTSLVQSMLASHSQLAFPPETNFIRRYLATGRIARLANQRGLQAVVALLESDQAFRRVGLSAAELVDAVSRAGEVTDFTLYRHLLRTYAESRGKPRIADKDPRSVEYLGLLARLFPDAWVVHVIRDPRDVIASKKVAAWSSGRSPLQHIFANRVQLRMGRRDGRRLFGARYQEVLYERLLADPENVLQTVCSRLGVQYEPNMLEFGRAASDLVSQSELSWKRETLGPLLADNPGKWRQALSAWETAATERACEEAMSVGRYSPSDATVSLQLMPRIAMTIFVAAVKLADPIYATLRRASSSLT